MSRIRGKDSKPETIVRKCAHALGYRFRIHRLDLPGTPDLVFPGRHKVVFVHGCWWHRHEGCHRSGTPKTRSDYWQAKFDRNVARDARVEAQLRDAGWDVLVIWECQTRDLAVLGSALLHFLGPPGDIKSGFINSLGAPLPRHSIRSTSRSDG